MGSNPGFAFQALLLILGPCVPHLTKGQWHSPTWKGWICCGNWLLFLQDPWKVPQYRVKNCFIPQLLMTVIAGPLGSQFRKSIVTYYRQTLSDYPWKRLNLPDDNPRAQRVLCYNYCKKLSQKLSHCILPSLQPLPVLTDEQRKGSKQSLTCL